MAVVIDGLGNELAVGSRVKLINIADVGDPPRYKIGTEAVIICLEDGDGDDSIETIGVHFEDEKELGHDLSGKVLDNRGWWINPTCLELIKEKGKKTSADPYKDFGLALSDKTRYMVVGNAVYELKEVQRINSASEILEQRDKESAVLLKAQLDKVKRREEELIAESRRKLLMPDIEIEHIVKGLSAYKEGGAIVYVSRLKYAPKFVLRDKSTYQISDADQKRTTKDVFLVIKINISGAISFIDVSDTDGYKFVQFQHYHQNCFGTMKFPSIKRMGDILVLRDQVQSMLETINSNSKANDSPRNMPQFKDLFDRSTLLGDSGKAGVMKRDSFGTPEIYVGDMIVVLSAVDKFPADKVGATGRVISSSENSREELIIGVEFTFKHDQFHDAHGLGKDKHCYYFPSENVSPIDGDGNPIKDRPDVRDRKKPTKPLRAVAEGVFGV